MSDIAKIINQLEQQRHAIDQAISALRQVGAAGPGRKAAAKPLRRKRRGRLSPEGRKRIAEAARRRWAELRAKGAAAGKKAVKK